MAVHDPEDIVPSVRHVLRLRGGRAIEEERGDRKNAKKTGNS
jgi:hypothetical protein